MLAAPGLFTVGDEGKAALLVDEVDESERTAAEHAVKSCPERALTIRVAHNTKNKKEAQ
jgi:ferredoxin